MFIIAGTLVGHRLFRPDGWYGRNAQIHGRLLLSS
jgi:hypothetical protein